MYGCITKLVDEQTHIVIARKPSQYANEDYEYLRQRVTNIFMVCEPLKGNII